MKASRRGVALRQLLDLCDDLQRIRTQLAGGQLARDARSRLRRQERTKRDRLARDLQKYRFHGPLAQLLREFRFDLVHFQLLATLLQRHLRSEDPATEGRALLSSVFENSFDVLAGIDLLREDGVLRASGVVVLQDQEDVAADDLLGARFRISEDALIAFRDEIAGLVVEDRSGARLTYAGNHEYLVDLRILHNLYKHRSERVFHHERWDRVHAGGGHALGRQLTRRIEQFRHRIDARLANTPDATEFPAVRFFREHHLDDDEQIVVVHLLFKELYEGNAYADVADLLRLCSADELSLVRSRRLVDPHGRLRRAEILQIESLVEGRDLTGEASLSDWVVNQLFGAAIADERIDTDARLDWHLYLKNLEDTQSFFRDLEAN
ncbi:MAG: hypothetical protein IPM29_31515 [Planctomycetes bacterium]|nr:hypothetical protein [Planctomycetota bacterium]